MGKENKTSKRKRNNVFVFDPEVPKKKRLQLSCKIQGNTKSKLTRKTKILQKNPMKYTHKKVELKKKNLRKKKTINTFFLFCCTRTCKTYLNRLSIALGGWSRFLWWRRPWEGQTAQVW